jgi:hypothetical protein
MLPSNLEPMYIFSFELVTNCLLISIEWMMELKIENMIIEVDYELIDVIGAEIILPLDD